VLASADRNECSSTSAWDSLRSHTVARIVSWPRRCIARTVSKPWMTR
jgi:hypothetical protein